MVSCIESLRDPGNSKREIFLLTKPPHNDRTELCLKMIEHSGNAILYLVGDGVYNLMSESLEFLPSTRIFVCKEDMDARGIQTRDKAAVLVEFYEHLVEGIMWLGDRVYTF
jgi:tRNA 2-thiouridine synthesizing protein B